MLTLPQIRAARALISWSQSDLAKHCGLSQNGIARIESGDNIPTSTSLGKIRSAFERQGVVFTAHGVEHYKNQVSFFRDFLEVLDDAQDILQAGDEILLHCADERRNSTQVTERFQLFVDQKIKLRFTVAEGNTVFTTNAENYRHINKDYVADSQVSVIYGDKYVLQIGAEDKIFIVIHSADFVSAMRKQFEYWWKRGSHAKA